MNDIQTEKLDDIQLSMYLAQKHYQGQSVTEVLKTADRMLQWIRDKRSDQPEENRNSISELLNNK